MIGRQFGVKSRSICFLYQRSHRYMSVYTIHFVYMKPILMYPPTEYAGCIHGVCLDDLEAIFIAHSPHHWHDELGPLLLTWFNFNLSMDK